MSTGFQKIFLIYFLVVDCKTGKNPGASIFCGKEKLGAPSLKI